MWNWLRSIQWLPLTLTALITVLGFNLLSWLEGQSFKIPWSDHAEIWVAIFTFTLTASTIALWLATRRLASDARDSANELGSRLIKSTIR